MITNPITIIVDDSEVQSLFKALSGFGRDLREPMSEIGDAIANSTRIRFDRGEDPTGQKWQALAWSTILARAARGRSLRRGGKLVTASGIFRAAFQRQLIAGASSAKPLRDTGTHLFSSLTYQLVGSDAVVVGVAHAWARIHQYGGQAGRGRRTRIPARPIFGITLEDRRDIVAILGGALGRRITGL